MKKFVALLLVAVMLLSLAACGGKEAEPANPVQEKEEPVIQTEAPAEQTQAPAEEEEDIAWGVTQKHTALGRPFYLNFPELSGIPYGSATVAYQNDKSLCILDAQYVDSPEVSSVEEVLPAYFEQTDIVLLSYYQFRGSDFNYPISEQETMTINGYEMCKYIGQLQFSYSGEARDYKYVAYSSQLTTGEYVFWMVVDETDDQSLGDVIEDYAYNMALTLREEI